MLETSNSGITVGGRQLLSPLMAKLIDPEDLVDAAGVAQILGLASRSVVSVYRSRYEDFPQPVVERGQCRLWSAETVRNWAIQTGRMQ